LGNLLTAGVGSVILTLALKYGAGIQLPITLGVNDFYGALFIGLLSHRLAKPLLEWLGLGEGEQSGTAADKTAADKTAADKTAADKTAADKTAADKMAVDKMAADKMAADKMAADKMAADKMAADKMAADKN
jgi:hypothetical protein